MPLALALALPLALALALTDDHLAIAEAVRSFLTASRAHRTLVTRSPDMARAPSSFDYRGNPGHPGSAPGSGPPTGSPMTR
ncbi:hypothetical protein [Nocardia sp. NPDC005366]|uniref:hypothetical protein n=1 Tax=Nocardia sp. NPDC005366 TaxID=3156878 RepID=UPI0033AC19FD